MIKLVSGPEAISSSEIMNPTSFTVGYQYHTLTEVPLGRKGQSEMENKKTFMFHSIYLLKAFVIKIQSLCYLVSNKNSNKKT